MTSKIINMAEHIKDDADRMLESMFASDPVPDDGFSVRVVRKVRRRIWVRRLTLPIATFCLHTGDHVADVMKELGQLTGRQYDLVTYTGAPDAEKVILVMGSGTGVKPSKGRFPVASS